MSLADTKKHGHKSHACVLLYKRVNCPEGTKRRIDFSVEYRSELKVKFEMILFMNQEIRLGREIQMFDIKKIS